MICLRSRSIPSAWPAAMPLHRLMGELQEKVISRLMGLLLSAIAVQMLVSGLKASFPLLGATARL